MESRKRIGVRVDSGEYSRAGEKVLEIDTRLLPVRKMQTAVG